MKHYGKLPSGEEEILRRLRKALKGKRLVAIVQA
jgi:hypothetical protein